MNVTFNTSDLHPIIDLAVEAAVHRVQTQQKCFADRIAITEAEAARALGVKPHVMRDLRRRGEIQASRVGKRIVYECDEILDFLRRTRTSTESS